ncbi:DEAD-domain-containing protein, partial [Rozella allomycis CSF55]
VEIQNFRKEHNITLENAPEDHKPCLSFATLKVHKKILKTLEKFPKPTPIQSECWPLALKGRDVVGIAMTGSGKTYGFGVPAINHLKKSDMPNNAILILAPTRELALQIQQSIDEMGSKLEGLTTVTLYGGVSKDSQRKLLKKGTHVIVATPGRLIDLMDEGVVDLSAISFLILDEADRMLDMGFINDIRKIVKQIPEKRQTLMFSATWPNSVRQLASEFLKNPVKITIGFDELTSNTNVTQIVEVIQEPRDRDNKLISLLKKYHSSRSNRVIVFALYKKEAVRIENFLKQNKYNVESIHGDKNQNQRWQALQSFKNGDVPLLIATDVAARGLDIPDVEYVINYTFPLTIEDYTHRIGRCGRAGKTGIAHTMFTPLDKAHSGELINVLKQAEQKVPEALLKFGTTVKKKEHKTYGAFFKEIDPNAKSSHVTFDDDD